MVVNLQSAEGEIDEGVLNRDKMSVNFNLNEKGSQQQILEKILQKKISKIANNSSLNFFEFKLIFTFFIFFKNTYL